MLISVILTTKDRADDLQETLHSLGQVTVPKGCTCEVLIVDNASQDHTPAVIRAARLPNMTARPLLEENVGQSNARNRGISQARGDVLIFTDDDLRYHRGWLEDMTCSILSGDADAMTGAMQLAPHLERSWMRPMHYIWLAAPSGDRTESGTPELIGANMALHRRVFDHVPRFDPELGPGAYGFGDDTLFGYQIARAGSRIGTVTLQTEHHLLPERLTRASFLIHAKKLGQTGAYLAYHWEHKSFQMAQVNFCRKICQLAAWRRLHPREVRSDEGMHPSEMHHLRSLHLYGQALIERRRPRNYECFGLVKKLG